MISVVNEIELLFGSRDNRDLTQIRKLLATFEIIQIDVTISQRASFLVDKFCLSHRLEMPDAMIAATTLVNAFELATINRKDFRYIDGLKLVDYP